MNSELSSAEYRRMTETPVASLVVRLAVPTVVSSLITSVYNMADTYFVGQLGNSATGAVGVVFAVQSIIQAFGFGLGMGATSLISRHLGKKENEAACRVGTSAFAASLVVGILLLVGGVVWLRPLMQVFGSTATILPFACDYGFYILLGAPVMCATFVLNNILRAEGQARLSMVGIATGGLLNIALDPILIELCCLGIRGAAIATVMSQCVSFLILLGFYLRKKSIVALSPRYLSRRPGDYFLILKTGFPTICRQGLGSLSTTLLNLQVRPYGDAAVSAISIANKIYMLLRMALLGIGQGFQPVAGYNFGAKKYDRVKKAFSVAVVLGTAFAVCASAVTARFGGALVGLFRRGDAAVIPIGETMLAYLSLSLPTLGYSTYVNQLYQCLGHVYGATFLASCRQGIFFVPLILLLPMLFGLRGVQMAQAAADLATFVVSIPFQCYFYKKVLSGRQA